MPYLTFPSPTSRIAAIGECMIEIANAADGKCLRGFGGDTLNTAVYLARQNVDVSYITRLGDDIYSNEMIENWQAEGINTDLVSQDTGRVPGLYMIETDEKGERTFTYWRDRSPARELFNSMNNETIEAICQFDILYLSGITLSLYDQRGCQQLFSILDDARKRGGLVAFDGNYRPLGWPSQDQARETFCEMMKRTDLMLPTFEDEKTLFGDQTPEDTAHRLHAQGVSEIVIKNDAKGCLISDGEADLLHVPTTAIENPVDTTAAGDSFNAGYLAARLSGNRPEDAARHAHVIASKVICHPGAIIPTTIPLTH